MTAKEINFITDRVIDKIKEKYFLTEKSLDLTPTTERQIITSSFVDHVIDTVCRYYGITRAKIQSRTRSNYNEIINYGEIRFIIFRLCRDIPDTGMSLAEIGKPLGRDHSSVLYGLRRIEWYMSHDQINSRIAKDYRAIEKLLKTELS